MIGKLISESYWLENSQLDEIYNFGVDYCSRRFLTLFMFLSSFIDFCLKLDVGDFKLASISGISGLQIQRISLGSLLADRSR